MTHALHLGHGQWYILVQRSDGSICTLQQDPRILRILRSLIALYETVAIWCVYTCSIFPHLLRCVGKYIFYSCVFICICLSNFLTFVVIDVLIASIVQKIMSTLITLGLYDLCNILVLLLMVMKCAYTIPICIVEICSIILQTTTTYVLWYILHIVPGMLRFGGGLCDKIIMQTILLILVDDRVGFKCKHKCFETSVLVPKLKWSDAFYSQRRLLLSGDVENDNCRVLLR